MGTQLLEHLEQFIAEGGLNIQVLRCDESAEAYEIRHEDGRLKQGLTIHDFGGSQSLHSLYLVIMHLERLQRNVRRETHERLRAERARLTAKAAKLRRRGVSMSQLIELVPPMSEEVE